jgi:uncharacterized protein (TIGR00251 family)
MNLMGQVDHPLRLIGSDPMATVQIDMAEFRVKVLPRSSRNQIAGTENGVIKVKLTAPPIDGKANDALKGFLAKRLRVAKKNVQIISGERSKIKSVRVHGISPDDVTRLLEGDA